MTGPTDGRVDRADGRSADGQSGPADGQSGPADGRVDRSASEGRVETTPLLRVVKGDATAEEVAALVAVVAARGAAAAAVSAAAGAPRRRSAWGDPALAVRPPHNPGPDGWRRLAFPR